MRQIVPLKWSACPCGWKVPVNKCIATDEATLQRMGSAEFLCDCPECGRQYRFLILGDEALEDEALEGKAT